MSDTIFAPATGRGRGAVAIVRISGPGAAGLVAALAGALPPPRRAALRRLRDGTGAVLDEALVLWFPAPASFTGEDCAELQVHGGPAVLAAVSRALETAGARLAEPGEFTRRAFERGRLDLAQAEGLADLVAAETDAQRRQALDQLGGGLSGRYQDWCARLLDALAFLEASVDFADEAEAVADAEGRATPVVQAVQAELASAVADLRGERVREGFRVALVGAPNVGKSSLLNALAGRDAAIVTPIAGTTRDVVEVALTLAGQLVLLADTAGLRDSRDAIEAEGVRRARQQAETADLRLGVVDAARAETRAHAVEQLRAGDLLVVNKSDLGLAELVEPPPGVGRVAVCALRPGGVEALRGALSERLGREGPAAPPAVTRDRHRQLLAQADGHLRRMLAGDRAAGAELAAEDVRLALHCLERVTGRRDPEAVLDRVFSTFCLGK